MIVGATGNAGNNPCWTAPAVRPSAAGGDDCVMGGGGNDTPAGTPAATSASRPGDRLVRRQLRDLVIPRDVLLQERSTPGFGVDVVERLGERPLVSCEVGGRVLALAVLGRVGSMRIVAPCARARTQWALTSSTRTVTECVTAFQVRATVMAWTSPTMTARPVPTLSCERRFSPICSRSTNPNAPLSQATASRTSG